MKKGQQAYEIVRWKIPAETTQLSPDRFLKTGRVAVHKR